MKLRTIALAAALATAFAVGKQLKKSSVLVKDAPAFVVNRVLTRMTSVLMDSLEHGNTVEETDEAILRLGMPMAPSVLLQMVGPRVANHVLHTLHDAYPDRFPLSPTLDNFAAGSEEIVVQGDARRSIEQITDGQVARGTLRDLSEPVERGYTTDQAVTESTRCLMCNYNIWFDPFRCVLCGACADVCPEGVIHMVDINTLKSEGLLPELEEAYGWENGGAMILDEERCIRCALCVKRCPFDAITMERFELQEISTDGRLYKESYRDAQLAGTPGVAGGAR